MLCPICLECYIRYVILAIYEASLAKNSLQKIWSKHFFARAADHPIYSVTIVHTEPSAIITRIVSAFNFSMADCEAFHRIGNVNGPRTFDLLSRPDFPSVSSINNVHASGPLACSLHTNIFRGLWSEHPRRCGTCQHIPNCQWIVQLQTRICLSSCKRLDLLKCFVDECRGPLGKRAPCFN